MTKTNHSCKYLCRKRTRHAFRAFIPLMLVLLFSFSGRSQSIANWTFNSLLTGTPGLFNSIGLADFSPAVPVHAFNGGGEYYGEGGWPSGAINTSMYLQFILSPLPGYQLDINNVVLKMRRSNTGSPAGSGPNNWALRSSLDGFTTNIASGSITYNYADYTVNPGSSFINLYLPVIFRLYGYNATVNTGGNSRLVLDNISATGLGYLLPLRLESFKGILQQQKVSLSYTLYNTEENAVYATERSTDGTHFTPVSTVKEFTAAAEKKYILSDDIATLTGIQEVFYRIKIFHPTGSFFYSPVIKVNVKSSSGSVKAFISSNQLCISGSFPQPGICRLDLYSLQGAPLLQTTFNAVAGYNAITTTLKNYAAGTYIVQVSGKNGRITTAKVIIP